MKPRNTLRSDIAWSTHDRIGVFGYDLTRDLMGKINLGDMGFLEIAGHLPNARESRMFNALLVTLVEHGIVPSTLATRLTYAGAPESIQAAVAAGLLGLGSVFVGSTEGAARMLRQALPDPKAKVALPALAERIVAEHRDAKRILPGFGHPIHKPVDPRSVRLFAVARATGAIGAICCEMGLPWQVCRGMGVMARAVGLVGHILEESRKPMALEVWRRVEEEASAHARGKLRRRK